jgi:hypothetical protein
VHAESGKAAPTARWPAAILAAPSASTPAAPLSPEISLPAAARARAALIGLLVALVALALAAALGLLLTSAIFHTSAGRIA